MARTLALTLMLWLFGTGAAVAEVLLLLPGHLDGGEWRRSGAMAAILQHGWGGGGHLVDGPRGVTGLLPAGARTVYTVALPTTAPIPVQSRVLAHYVDAVKAVHEGESLYLAGHSAGGVVGRTFMVEQADSPVAALITVAAPHLGTGTAEVGRAVGQSPLAWIAPMVGAEALNWSQGLYQDLRPEQPGSFLFWLNRQPHPPATYISIIRGDAPWGDWVVPSASQDMNRVPALYGKATAVVAGTGHTLAPGDGALIARLLESLRQP